MNKAIDKKAFSMTLISQVLITAANIVLLSNRLYAEKTRRTCSLVRIRRRIFALIMMCAEGCFLKLIPKLVLVKSKISVSLMQTWMRS